jgi:hypothetical protein
MEKQQQQIFKAFAYVSPDVSPDVSVAVPAHLSTCSKTIPSCKDLRKLNLHIEKNKKNEERASKLKDEYVKKLDTIIKKNSQYQTTSIVDRIYPFKIERDELINNTYYGYTDKNTFEDTILHIIEWFKDYSSKMAFKTFENIIDTLSFEKQSRYLLKNIIDNPLELIQIQHSPIKFNQAYRIVKELDIPFTDELLVQKWSIFAVQDNNGSFYKIKSHPDSKNKYKEYSDRPFKQGWYWLLRKFCEENNMLSTKYATYLDILNGLLVQHKTIKYLYGIKEFVEIETVIGDDTLDLYYDNNETIDDIEKFERFIHEFEEKKSTNEKPFKFNDEQVSAIKHTITDKLCIITGPPGTGKSTITEATIEWFNQESARTGFQYNISLMAPTGKALKGLTDKCKNIKNNDICGTLHKCLLNTFPKIVKEIDDSDNDNDNDKKYPQYINKIIVDETSMVDIFMFKKLLKECKYFDCSLVLCGDIKQLPPVGKGRPFECIIHSELFNTVYLTEIKRQDTGKLKDCIIKINKKELSMDDFDNESTIFTEHDFINNKKTVRICKDIVHKYGKEHVAFITPEHNKTPGVFEMNKLLQNDVYNHDNPYEHGYFKEGDYVMRTENKYDDDVIRVNGDTGKMYFKEVVKMNPKTNKSYKENVAWIFYDDEQTPMEEVAVCDIKDKFTLNYCNTVHKYQGSQKDVVVFIASSLHSSLSWGTNRLKLAYTAISRAAKTLIVLGDKKTFFDIQTCKDEPFVTSFMKEFNEYDFE